MEFRVNTDPRRAAVIQLAHAWANKKRLWDQTTLAGPGSSRFDRDQAEKAWEAALRRLGELCGRDWVQLGQDLPETGNADEIMRVLDVICPISKGTQGRK
jgi:hypothetical protein